MSGRTGKLFGRIDYSIWSGGGGFAAIFVTAPELPGRKWLDKLGNPLQ